MAKTKINLEIILKHSDILTRAEKGGLESVRPALNTCRHRFNKFKKSVSFVW